MEDDSEDNFDIISCGDDNVNNMYINVTCDPVIHLLMANRLNDFVYCPDSVSINVMSMLSFVFDSCLPLYFTCMPLTHSDFYIRSWKSTLEQSQSILDSIHFY